MNRAQTKSSSQLAQLLLLLLWSSYESVAQLAQVQARDNGMASFSSSIPSPLPLCGNRGKAAPLLLHLPLPFVQQRQGVVVGNGQKSGVRCSTQ